MRGNGRTMGLEQDLKIIFELLEGERKGKKDIGKLVDLLWESSPGLKDVFKNAKSTEEARKGVYEYLARKEYSYLMEDGDLVPLEKANALECIRVFKSIISTNNEKRSGASALETLISLAGHRDPGVLGKVSPGFILEFVHLFKGLEGDSGIYKDREGKPKPVPEFLSLEGREAAKKRSESLDRLAAKVRDYLDKYPSGLEEEVIARRAENKKRILGYFKATEEDWANWKWHVGHVIKDSRMLADLIEVTEEQREAVAKAISNKIPFGITPYYLSLMERKAGLHVDHAVRAQVIPPPEYVETMAEHKSDRSLAFDFMREHDTSPVDLITRRYPLIAIIKPFNTCSQICVYCQRNWEIEECLARNAMASKKSIGEAIEWIRNHPGLGDILITGGDPWIMSDKNIEEMLSRLSSIPSIYRIRIGTRTPVVLPQRWTESLLEILKKYHAPGKRELAVVTHFEHAYEVTPEAMEAVQKVLKLGIRVYNQEVFTVENSRRFETAKLRVTLRSIGVDPYYTFNMKGKEETRRYMVPIARLLQERKEEARLLPGLDRTDEPVFNVPRLGKNHLRAWQDHNIIGIRPDGRRVYEFHPWEKNISLVPTYVYVDVPIFEYLNELSRRGEDVWEYRTIWYYY